MTRITYLQCERCATRAVREMRLDTPSNDWTNCAVGLRSDVDFCPACWQDIAQFVEMTKTTPKQEPDK